MTLTDNEDSGTSSNSEIPHIDEKNIQEQDINLQIGTSSSQEQKMEIIDLTTDEELESSPKRSRITESNEAESSKTNEQESDYSDDTTFNDIGQDPLLVTEEVLLKYNDFCEYLYQILKNDEGKEDWSYDIIDRVDTLVMTLGRRLRVVAIDMAGLEAAEGMENEYEFKRIHIPIVLSSIRQINREIAESSSFRLVSDVKTRGKALPFCLGEFEMWRQELSHMIDVMQRLKIRAREIEREYGTN